MLGIKARLNFSVFSAAGASLPLATFPAFPCSVNELPRPAPGHGEVLVRVAAAGVGPWDALIREQKSVVNPPLPLILGSDLSGVIEEVGPGVSPFKAGDEI